MLPRAFNTACAAVAGVWPAACRLARGCRCAAPLCVIELCKTATLQGRPGCCATATKPLLGCRAQVAGIGEYGTPHSSRSEQRVEPPRQAHTHIALPCLSTHTYQTQVPASSTKDGHSRAGHQQQPALLSQAGWQRQQSAVGNQSLSTDTCTHVLLPQHRG